MRTLTVWAGISLLLLGQLAAPAASAQQDDPLIMFDFEGGTEEWSIPDWAVQNTQDYVGVSATASTEYASHGDHSLQVMANFPGERWTGAYIERIMYVTDWSQFGALAVDLYLPYNAPRGLKARFILGTGDKWTWTEMNRALPLEPDRWTTITANLKPGSLDWKFFPDDLFRKDIRKVGLRIESDHEPAYQGPVFVDQIRLVK